MKVRLALTALLLGAGCLQGCATRGNAVVQCTFPRQAAPRGDALVAEHYGRMTPIPLNAVQFTDAALSRRLVVQSLQATRTPTDSVEVTARFVNCTDATLQLGARLHFMNAQNVPAEPQSAWQILVLQPRSMAVYQENSLSAGVLHYVMELRNADP